MSVSSVSPRVMEVRAARLHIPLTRSLTTASDARVRTVLLIGVTLEGGAEGWGEVSPLEGLHGETLDEASGDAQLLASRLVHGGPVTLDAIDGCLPSVAWGIYSAIEAARAAHAGVSLCARFAETMSGDCTARHVEVAGLASVTDTLPDVTTVKLKVGRGSLDDEVAAIRALVQAHPEITLRLDGNRRLDAERTRALAVAAGARLALFEEPMADTAAMLALAEAHAIPIALDEALVDGTGDLSHPAVKAAVLKPSALGPARTFALARRARELGRDVVISSAFESSLGLTVLAHLAAALAPTTAAGLGTARWFEPAFVPAHLAHAGRIDLVPPHPGDKLGCASPEWHLAHDEAAS